jgi:hypothetical protein
MYVCMYVKLCACTLIRELVQYGQDKGGVVIDACNNLYTCSEVR